MIAILLGFAAVAPPSYAHDTVTHASRLDIPQAYRQHSIQATGLGCGQEQSADKGEIRRHPVGRPHRRKASKYPAGLCDEEAGITEAFNTKLVQISANLHLNPEDLLAVMYCESGLKGSARNPYSNAVGLIQFLPGTLASIGFRGTTDDFCSLSETEQLTGVERYLSKYQRYGLDDAGRIFQAVFMPGSLRSGNEILVDSRTDPAAYRRNSVLDIDRDGLITVFDLAEFANIKCRKPAYRYWLHQLQPFE